MAHREKFVGKSAKGDFQEALANAAHNAQKASTAADELVTWRLEKTEGEAGGIGGLRTITITIQACFTTR